MVKKNKSPSTQETQVQSLSLEDTLEKEMATHASILAWNKEKQQRRPRKMDFSTKEGLSPRQKLNRNLRKRKRKKG